MPILQIPKPWYDDSQIKALIADTAYGENFRKEDNSIKKTNRKSQNALD